MRSSRAGGQEVPTRTPGVHPTPYTVVLPKGEKVHQKTPSSEKQQPCVGQARLERREAEAAAHGEGLVAGLTRRWPRG